MQMARNLIRYLSTSHRMHLVPRSALSRKARNLTLRLPLHVVETEGPVRDEVLARRIARAHGWTRTGARIVDRVMDLAKVHFETEQEIVGSFVWPRREDARAITFRRPAAGAARSVDEISLVELTALATKWKRLGYDMDAGVSAMSRDIGLQRVRAASRERLEQAWAAAVG